MTRANPGGAAGGANRNDAGAAALGAADWLCLAAAPTFALMAVLTAVSGGPADVLCSVAPGALPVGGMVPMYGLMSAFHAAPWLRLIAGRRGRSGPMPAAPRA